MGLLVRCVAGMLPNDVDTANELTRFIEEDRKNTLLLENERLASQLQQRQQSLLRESSSSNVLTVPQTPVTQTPQIKAQVDIPVANVVTPKLMIRPNSNTSSDTNDSTFTPVTEGVGRSRSRRVPTDITMNKTESFTSVGVKEDEEDEDVAHTFSNICTLLGY